MIQQANSRVGYDPTNSTSRTNFLDKYRTKTETLAQRKEDFNER